MKASERFETMTWSNELILIFISTLIYLYFYKKKEYFNLYVYSKHCTSLECSLWWAVLWLGIMGYLTWVGAHAAQRAIAVFKMDTMSDGNFVRWGDYECIREYFVSTFTVSCDCVRIAYAVRCICQQVVDNHFATRSLIINIKKMFVCLN